MPINMYATSTQQHLHNNIVHFSQTRESSPTPSTDSDAEYFPGNFPPVPTQHVNRFVELTESTPRTAKKWLHQHRDVITGDILFDDAISAFFELHDHEDDEEYVYDDRGCFCLERATVRVLDETIREVREELGREQGDEMGLWYGVRERIEMKLAHGVPWVVVERVRDRVDGILEGIGWWMPSMHQQSFTRSFNSSRPANNHSCGPRVKKIGHQSRRTRGKKFRLLEKRPCGGSELM